MFWRVSIFFSVGFVCVFSILEKLQVAKLWLRTAISIEVTAAKLRDALRGKRLQGSKAFQTAAGNASKNGMLKDSQLVGKLGIYEL